MKVKEALKDERIEHIKYITVFTKDNKLVKDIKVSYDMNKIKEAVEPYLNNDCEFWQEDHNDGYCDTGYISWSFWELHIYE